MKLFCKHERAKMLYVGKNPHKNPYYSLPKIEYCPSCKKYSIYIYGMGNSFWKRKLPDITNFDYVGGEK